MRVCLETGKPIRTVMYRGKRGFGSFEFQFCNVCIVCPWESKWLDLLSLGFLICTVGSIRPNVHEEWEN